MKKGVLENFAKSIGKHLWLERNFQENLFYRPLLDDCFWVFPATLLKRGTADSVWKTSEEYSLSINISLKSTVLVYHFILGSINVRCMFSLVYTVYFQKQPPK